MSDDLILCRWSRKLPTTDVQDPLGLGLRGSTRLAGLLLHCITSITPRARYYSFIPWCIRDYRRRERGRPGDSGLKDAIVRRERGLTLGCVVHHAGQPCAGGGLVGVLEAQRWFGEGGGDVELDRVRLSAVPAVDAYFNSIVNLGCFLTEEERPDIDEETEFTFDDIELSPLGERLADAYGALVDSLEAVRKAAELPYRCTPDELAGWGRIGGLCEVSAVPAADRLVLRDIFFDRSERRGRSHEFRRKSLVLILSLCHEFSAAGWGFSQAEFAAAVYFREAVSTNGDRFVPSIATSVADISDRWRMFYFHHYMSVGLEGMFSWLLHELDALELAGGTIDGLTATLDSPALARAFGELTGSDIGESFGSLSIADLLPCGPEIDRSHLESLSAAVDESIRPEHPFAEDRLERSIREGTFAHAGLGLAVPLVLFGVTLVRFARWFDTGVGRWLAGVAADRYLDLVPPVLSADLIRDHGAWWQMPMRQLAERVLSRYVVLQHRSMAYEKSRSGGRCLLQVDGRRLVGAGRYDRIGLGNPRLRSAMRILTDLNLLAETDGRVAPTPEGLRLEQEERDD